MFTTKKKTTSVSCVEIQIFLISFVAVLSFLLGKDCNYLLSVLILYFSDFWTGPAFPRTGCGDGEGNTRGVNNMLFI